MTKLKVRRRVLEICHPFGVQLTLCRYIERVRIVRSVQEVQVLLLLSSRTVPPVLLAKINGGER